MHDSDSEGLFNPTKQEAEIGAGGDDDDPSYVPSERYTRTRRKMREAKGVTVAVRGSARLGAWVKKKEADENDDRAYMRTKLSKAWVYAKGGWRRHEDRQSAKCPQRIAPKLSTRG